ncbi:MAG: tetratricopeptide repeat protein [Comamonas sp.]|jgi:hypothetical protein|nr:tetratricopeptide repeat protein [Comamonas sp.]
MHTTAHACGLTLTLVLTLAGTAQAQPVPALFHEPERTEFIQQGGTGLSELRAYAELGYVAAQYQLAQRYLQSQGVERDAQQAALWLGRAAEEGDPRAQLELALLYLHGKGVPRSNLQAAHWMLQAAESGYQHAQLKVGAMYEHGLGLSKDPTEAYFWYCLASEGVWGNHQAVKERDRLGAQLTHVQRTSARTAVFHWRPH